MIPYKCPVCDGTGIVSKPPHIAGDVHEWTSDRCTYPCQACGGKGIKEEKMNKEKLESIVVFCILMENNKGIMGKAPSYIASKFVDALERGKDAPTLLDNSNMDKFKAWKELWVKEVK